MVKRKLLDEVDFHLTNKCNLSCSYCCYDSGRLEIKEMTTIDAIKCINKIYESGADKLHFTGGEPLIRGDLFTLIKHAVDLGFDLRLQTNGYLLDEKIGKKLRELGLKKIMISLDGPCEVHDKMRGKHGAFLKAISAIKTSKNMGFETRINTVINKDNLDYLHNTFKLGLELEADIHSFFYMTPMGSGRANRKMWVEPSHYFNKCRELQEYITREKENIDKDYKIIIEEEYCLDEDKNIEPEKFCRVKGEDGGCCLVLCNGEIFPCVLFLELPNSSLGNLLDDDLTQIWEGRLNQQAIARKIKDEDCITCKFYEACNGGCPPYSYLWYKSIDRKDPRCEKPLLPLCPAVKTKELTNK